MKKQTILSLALLFAFMQFAQAQPIQHLDTLWKTRISPEIVDVKFTKDGNHVLVAGLYKIYMFETLTGIEVRQFDQGTSQIAKIAVSPDSISFATGNMDGKIFIWNINTGDTIKTMYCGITKLRDIDYSKDGNFIIGVVSSSISEFNILIFDINIGKLLTGLKAYEIPYGVSCSPMNNSFSLYMMKNGLNGTYGEVSTWDMISWTRKNVLGTHSGWIIDMSYSSNGKMLVTVGDGEVIKIWDTEGDSLLFYYDPIISHLRCANFTSDAKLIIFCLYYVDDCSIQILDIETKKIVSIFPNCALHLDISPNNKFIISATSNNLLLSRIPWETIGVIEPEKIIEINQAIPNPAEERTTIKFTLKKPGMTVINIFEENGRIVKDLLNNNLSEGEHTVIWDTKGISQGIYFCRIQTNNDIESVKIIIEK